MSSIGRTSGSETSEARSKTSETIPNTKEDRDNPYITSGATNNTISREYTLRPEKDFENIEKYLGRPLEISMEGYDVKEPELTVTWTDHPSHEDTNGFITVEVERTYLPNDSRLSKLYRHISESYSGLDNLLSTNERQCETVESQSWSSWKNIIETLEDR